MTAAALAPVILLLPGRRAALAIGTGTSAITAAAAALGRAHLLQLFHLLGSEDFLELRLRLSFEGRDLLLLVGGEIELLFGTRRQQVKPARTTAAGAGFAAGRAFAGRRRAASLILSGYVPG